MNFHPTAHFTHPKKKKLSNRWIHLDQIYASQEKRHNMTSNPNSVLNTWNPEENTGLSKAQNTILESLYYIYISLYIYEK